MIDWNSKSIKFCWFFHADLKYVIGFVFRFKKKTLKFSSKFFVKNLSEFFVNLPNIREQNQSYIWNQHAKNYQTLFFQDFDQKSPSPLKGKMWHFQIPLFSVRHAVNFNYKI